MLRKFKIFSSLFVFLFLMASCGPVDEWISPHPDSIPQESYSLERFYSTRDPGQPDPIIPNELILFGPQNQLFALSNLFGSEEFEGFELIDPPEFTEAQEENVSDSFMLIYTGDKSEEEALAEIKTLTENDESAFPDLEVGKNYLVAAPWEVEGSPWEVEGSPWEVEGSGVGEVGDGFILEYPVSSGSEETVPHAIPWRQWAFQKGGPEPETEDAPPVDPWGIHLFEGNGTRTVEQTGEDIRVFIYDTSPFTESGEVTPGGFTTSIQVRNADTVLPDIEISNTDNYTYTVEHGLFVAGLVHFVAPNADIELVRVLNNQGVGELYTLTTELDKLLADNTDTDGNADLNNVVINLSLGFHPEVKNVDDSEFSDEEIVKAFRTQLEVISEAGAIIVAAAGNHSSEFLSVNSVKEIREKAPNYGDFFAFENGIDTMDSMYPARWATTISVSGFGTNLRGLSCFSNADDNSIMAPSGGGYQGEPQLVEGEEKPTVAICQSPRELCEGLGLDYNCQYSVVSTTTRGYGQWAGTSFGTPIVSGIVALVLEKCNQNEDLFSQTIRNFMLNQYKAEDQDPPNRLDVNRIMNERSCPSNPDD